MPVKLVASVQLLVGEEQKVSLLSTLKAVNSACAWLAEKAFKAKCADKIKLQRLWYRDIRDRFGLSAQHTVRTISKVCEAYKRDKTKKPMFKVDGAIAYDQRLYTFKNGLDCVSLLTVDGRITVPCAIGEHHRARLDGARGQADLVFRGGNLYLFVTVDVPEATQIDVNGWLGVDLGIRNLATDNDGERHSGDGILALRAKNAKLRASLQARNTKSAKRRLKKVAGREKRFAAHTNHVLSKKNCAQGQGHRSRHCS